VCEKLIAKLGKVLKKRRRFLILKLLRDLNFLVCCCTNTVYLKNMFKKIVFVQNEY
jgi:hypothetical protein